jgi:hypothetical protein
MVNEAILYKDDPSPGRRGTAVKLSMTDKAMNKRTLGILGIDEKTQRRKNLIQLLIFFKEFKRNDLMTEREIGDFLDKIGYSISDLEEIKKSDSCIVFEPIKRINIVKLIQNNSKADSEKICSFYIIVPGFTIQEFISYMEKLRNNRDPRPFSSYKGITDVPFVAYRNYTEDEIKQAVDSLRKCGLIRIVLPIFPGEIRYDIADEDLAKFVKDVWLVHLYEFRILDERLALNGKSEKEIKRYLDLLYNEKNADRILALAYNFRRSYKEENNAHESTEKKIAQKFVQDFDDSRIKLVQSIIKQHKKVIEKYDIIGELIDGVCFSDF